MIKFSSKYFETEKRWTRGKRTKKEEENDDEAGGGGGTYIYLYASEPRACLYLMTTLKRPSSLPSLSPHPNLTPHIRIYIYIYIKPSQDPYRNNRVRNSLTGKTSGIKENHEK